MLSVHVQLDVAPVEPDHRVIVAQPYRVCEVLESVLVLGLYHEEVGQTPVVEVHVGTFFHIACEAILLLAEFDGFREVTHCGAKLFLLEVGHAHVVKERWAIWVLDEGFFKELGRFLIVADSSVGRAKIEEHVVSTLPIGWLRPKVYESIIKVGDCLLKPRSGVSELGQSETTVELASSSCTTLLCAKEVVKGLLVLVEFIMALASKSEVLFQLFLAFIIVPLPLPVGIGHKPFLFLLVFCCLPFIFVLLFDFELYSKRKIKQCFNEVTGLK